MQSLQAQKRNTHTRVCTRNQVLDQVYNCIRAAMCIQVHTRPRTHACSAGSPVSLACNRPSSPPPFQSPHLRPRRPYVHLLLPFCHPLFIRSPGTREETWPHASSHGPNNGGYMGLWPLFARSCFDEVGLRPHNAVTFFSLPVSLLPPPPPSPIFSFSLSFSRFLSFGLLFIRSLPVTICFDFWVSRRSTVSL